MKKAFSLATLATLALPLISFAAINDVKGVGQFIIDTINGVLVPVLFSLAFIVFIWGAFNTFILGATSEDVKEKGKSLMLYGLIGFFVMLSVWGLVKILTGSVALENSQPTLPTGGGPLQ